MAIRAYKLAEELGIDRVEFVAKAAELGVALKSPMASIEDADIEMLRRKLGKSAARDAVVTEQRVDAGSGAAVIRRRKKAAPEPPPPAPAAPEPVRLEPEGGAEPVHAEQAEPEAAAEPGIELAPEPEVAPTEAPAPFAARPAAPSAPSAPGAVGERRPPRRAGAESSTGLDAEAAAKQRKRVREVVTLREQERLARQATGRTAARRPLTTVEPRTLASPRRKRRDALPARPAAAAARPAKPDARVLRIEGAISVGDLARLLGEKAATVQSRLMGLGTMVSINQSIDVETVRKVAAGFGASVEDVGFREDVYLEPTAGEAGGERVTRPPVVTVMGHVDHGKTSLLDAIRRTNVVAGEAGGITQHIGAYRASAGGRTLTFIDTPGHAAFTEMRARGARVTDIVVLVVAATEGIMPQTIEAIEHARAAGVPIIVAVNKMDLPGANPQQVRQRLMEHGLVSEEFGGETICVNVSATKGTGLDQLLEMLALQADVLELTADPKRRAAGVVLEARLDKGRGPVATVLVQDGTLAAGDVLVAGTCWGRVRAMEDENGKRVREAGPSVPVQVIGLSGVPGAGDEMHVVESERIAKEIVAHRQAERREKPAEARPAVSLEEFFAEAQGGGVRELRLVLKADVQGSVESLRDALLKLSTDEVKVSVLLAGVGAITESDVMLARASGAIVIGFHVRPEPPARKAAEGQGVDVRVYQIIYEVTEDVQKAMVGLLPPTISEAFLGRAEVRQTFSVPKVGTIAGCYVSEGLMRRNAQARLLRDGVQIHEGRLSSLKRFKDDAREVQTGFECGIGIEGYNDVKVGDVIEAFVVEEKPATL
jgi:translation initiation factor IF-2